MLIIQKNVNERMKQPGLLQRISIQSYILFGERGNRIVLFFRGRTSFSPPVTETGNDSKTSIIAEPLRESKRWLHLGSGRAKKTKKLRLFLSDEE